MRGFFATLCAVLILLFSTSAEAKRQKATDAPCVVSEHGTCIENLHIGSFFGSPPPTPFEGKSKRRIQHQTYVAGDLVSKARRYLGQTANQIGLHRATLWCAAFLNKITNGGTGSDLALSFAGYGRPASYGCVGCIAVLKRKRGGHVGVVASYDKRGNPIIISGNHNRRVGEGVYPVSRVIAWRS